MSIIIKQIDHELKELLQEFASAGIPPWNQLSIHSARRIEQKILEDPPGPSIQRIHEMGFSGPAGEVRVRIFTPDNAGPEPLPVLVYLRGGGWVVGNLDSDEGVCRGIAKCVGCIVVSVDYSRAPEHNFPVSVKETYQALNWCADNASAFGGDPNRIGVAGSSAGGNLAASTTILARETGRPSIEGQILFYPMLDPNQDRDSYHEYEDGPLITRDDIAWFWDHYLSDRIHAHNPLATPLRSRNLSGLPPTTVVTAGIDPLRDEGIAYAERLDDAGVNVKHRHYPELTHIFLNLAPAVESADEALKEVSEDIQEYL